jgi:DNA ligase (NAD+)
VEKLIFAIWKNWFNIDGIWAKQVELFLKEWIIQNIVDVFKIEEKRDEILQLEGFWEKSVNNLIEGIEKAKNQDIVPFLTSLWINWVGKKTSKIIAKLFTEKDNLLNFSYTTEEVEALYEIWPELAKNIVEYFTQEAHKRILEELLDILNIKFYEKKDINWNSVFKWKKVCITGSFELNWSKISRDELIKKLEEVGGEFVSSVSKKTDFLLAWENAGSKKEKAESLEVKIIELEYFLKNL